MNPPAALSDLALDPGSGVPLYRQLYAGIVAAILDGRLAPGSRLPSARALAAHWSIARGTVETAYHMLAGEGYVQARGAAGTRVAGDLDATGLRAGEAALTPPEAGQPRPQPSLLAVGLPALDAFPRALWARLSARQARELAPADLAYPPPGGLRVLREQVASSLAVSRGVSCAPEQVLITGGYQAALGLLTRLLLRPGETVWMEDPGYPGTRDALRRSGMRVVGVPVDDEGIDLRRAPGAPARLVVVTPTHQYPLGVTLSLPRRLALLAWAREQGAWIVEDDYDGEFRYSGRPVPSLRSLDPHGRVLYVGTFSKVLFPALGVGYLVVPLELVGPLTQEAALLHPPPPPPVQATVAAFLREGHFSRHVRRMRHLYAARRAALGTALEAHLGGGLQVASRPGGLHLLARLAPGVDDGALVVRLRAHGLAPSALSACAVEAPPSPGLLLGFTNVDVQMAGETAARLSRLAGWEAPPPTP